MFHSYCSMGGCKLVVKNVFHSYCSMGGCKLVVKNAGSLLTREAEA